MKVLLKFKFLGKYWDEIIDIAANFVDVSFLGIFSINFLINAVALALLGYIILKFYKEIKEKSWSLSPSASMGLKKYKQVFLWNFALQILIGVLCFNTIIKFALMSQSGVSATGGQAVETLLYLGEFFGISLISFVFCIFGIIWSIMRFHDIDKSGFMVLLMAVPLLNLYFLYILLFKEGNTAEKEPAPANEDETESEGKVYSKFEKIAIGLVAFGIITTGIMDFVNKNDSGNIFYGYKLACGYWKTGEDWRSTSVRIDTKTIDTDPMHFGSRIGKMNYEIQSVSSAADDIIVKFKITSGAALREGEESYGEMYFPKTNVNKMTLRFNWNSGKYEYRESYELNNSPYLRNLDGNLDIVICFGRQGYARYLDLSSIEKEVDDDGNINLSIDTISSTHDGKLYSRTHEVVMSPGEKSGTLKYSVIDGLPYFGAVNDNERRFIDLDVTGKSYSYEASCEAFLTTYFYAFGHNFEYPPHFKR